MLRSLKSFSRRVAAWTRALPGVLLAGAITLAMGTAAPVLAQPPVGPTDVAAPQSAGVSLIQVNGFSGKVPMKKVWKVHDSGDSGQWVLEFASGNMNTQMAWKVKFILPAGQIFKGLEVFTFNGPKSVTTAGADTWDGKVLIDEVVVSPWNMNHVKEQCIAQLTNGDGTFKDSATFDLVAALTEQVRAKGISMFPNAPPGSATTCSGQATPKTRVTAYIVNAGEKATVGGRPQRLSSAGAQGAGGDQPSRIPTGRPGRPVPPRDSGIGGSQQPKLGTLVLPAGPRLSGGQASGTAAKEKFDRKKPHVNVGTAPVRRLQLVNP